MNRRTLLGSTAGLLGVGLSGCASTGGDDPPPTTASPVASDIVESGYGPFAHDVMFHNRDGDPVSVTVRVRHEENLLYRQTHRISPTDTDRTIAGFTEETLPEGDRTVRIEFAHADQTKGVTVDVTDCFGDVLGSVESGELDVIYSIC